MADTFSAQRGGIVSRLHPQPGPAPAPTPTYKPANNRGPMLRPAPADGGTITTTPVQDSTTVPVTAAATPIAPLTATPNTINISVPGALDDLKNAAARQVAIGGQSFPMWALVLAVGAVVYALVSRR